MCSYLEKIRVHKSFSVDCISAAAEADLGFIEHLNGAGMLFDMQ